MIFFKIGICMSYTVNLDLVYEKLKSIKSKKYKHKFSVPGLWIEETPDRKEVNPFQFFLERIEKVRDLSKNKVNHIEPNVYNMFVRLTTSYDHNEDNSLVNAENLFKETGTFLKAITILPYIKNLGVNTIYLLPVTAIGEDEKKGNLGSPYAIKNPYLPDNNLSEPLLGLDVETEFKAFAEAVHLLGMKLVCEFVFRTASIDSDLTLEHPDWFYWINAKVKNRTAGEVSESKYGPPIFLKKELQEIKAKVEAGDFKDLMQPHEQHRKMFTETPKKVARVEGKIRGLLADKKTEVKIPGAFADWPPDDNQPAWTDVTFLKMYDNPKFNYIAYNTIRMYDTNLAKNEYKVADLWDYISGIIPHYVENYSLDGVMIDMGHALPHELRRRIVESALEKKQEFFFWEENFSLSAASVKDGYSAVLGYLPFDAHRAYKIRDLIKRFSNKDIPVNFFATSETHNTPRAFSRINSVEYLKSIYTICLFLPAVTFIHSGFEIAENNPVNTGLDFTKEEIEQYPPEKLGLFSAMQLDWDNRQNIVDFIREINIIKSEIIKEPDDIFSNSIHNIDMENQNLVAFIRRDKISNSEVLVISNFSDNSANNIEIDAYIGTNEIYDTLRKTNIEHNNGKFIADFQPYEVKVFHLKM